MKPKTELLDKTKKKKILEKLEEAYGVSKLPHLFIKTAKNKYRIYSGSLSKEEIIELVKNVNVELIGTRLCTIDDDDVRLTFDVMNLQIIKKKINKNIFEIPDNEVEKWLRGNNIEIETKSKEKFLAIKHKKDFLGIGVNQRDHIKNYVPKERRIKGK